MSGNAQPPKGAAIECPECRAVIALSRIIASAETLALLRAVLTLGGDAILAWRYTDAFRPRPGKELRPEKRLQLLAEVGEFLRKGVFKLGGKTRKVSRDAIREGMRKAIDAEKVALRNHNYLKQILVSQIEKAEAQAEERQEERKRRQRAAPDSRRSAPQHPQAGRPGFQPGENETARGRRDAAKEALTQIGEVVNQVTSGAKAAAEEAPQAEKDST